jgi:DNA-binding LacI/PurR family transcriptional regulator
VGTSHQRAHLVLDSSESSSASQLKTKMNGFAAAVPLTSVRQPRLQLRRTAADLLLDEVANPDHLHQQITFTPELVARASTGRRG